MQSKTSFFNKTLYRKNLTRFAPVWILYTLGLLALLMICWTGTSYPQRLYDLAKTLATEAIQILSIANMGYGLLAAQLLFGDLYNSRMCNALHALPMRREQWFVTNVLSGLTFSLIPTLVMALAALPLLMSTIVTEAWKIAFYLLLALNLQFLCFFGIAVFSAMCVGNRFTMVAGCGLVNFGAGIVYAVVDLLYTPLLYGVITPSRLAYYLTPVYNMVEAPLFEFSNYAKLMDLVETTGAAWETLSANYTLTAGWWKLLACAGAGLAMMVLALVLYRKRHLECAGDAVAFRWLVPVFQVLCSLFVMSALYGMTFSLLGSAFTEVTKYVLLAMGLAVGWFIGKMLIARSTRVFQLRNFYGLAALALIVALSFVGTYLDVLGIETRRPDPEDVESVFFESSYTRGQTLTEKEDIENMLRLHELAVGGQIKGGGDLYVKGYDGHWVQVIDSNQGLYDPTLENPEFTYVASIGLRYQLKNGSTMARRYLIWTEQEEGTIAREQMSRWDYVNSRQVEVAGETVSALEATLEHFRYMTVDPITGRDEAIQLNSREDALSFLEAVKKDCEAGTMAQDDMFHKDVFQAKEPVLRDGEAYYNRTECIYVSLRGDDHSWSVKVYPDSQNTVQWLRERDLLEGDVLPDISIYWTSIRK